MQSGNSQHAHICSSDYDIPDIYMKYVLGANRKNLISLYSDFPSVKFMKLHGGRSGFYLEAPSIIMLDAVKRALYGLVINAEKQYRSDAATKYTIKERNTRQNQYDAAVNIRHNLAAPTQPATTYAEIVASKNPYALLAIEEEEDEAEAETT
jgi:hypothetical protein